MRRVTLTQTGTGSSAVDVPDQYIAPFAIGIGVKVTGTVTYTVQHTFDDVFLPTFDPAAATWFDHPSLTAQTTNKDSNYAFPVAGIRLTVSAGSGTATAVLLQAGIAQ